MRCRSPESVRSPSAGVAVARAARRAAAASRGQRRRFVPRCASITARSRRTATRSSGARARPAPPRPAPRSNDRSQRSDHEVRQAQRRDGRAAKRDTFSPPPPPRSANIRVHTAQHSSLIGGRYQIVKRIGQGGMGKVYEVNHIHLSRRFALKIISNQVAETDEARELFYREARFASAMSHPAITSVVDFGEDEKVGMFMVMEFVDGEPLNRILFREKRIGVRKACEIVLAVAEALHYIHRQNVVHCDIKTENILIGEEEIEGEAHEDGREAARLRARAPARREPRVDLAVGHAALRRARADPRRAGVARERRLRRRHLAVRAAHRRGAVGWPGAEDPRRSPRRAAEAAVEDGRGARSGRREARPARAREAARRTPQGHGGVHLRAAHRDGHARVRAPSRCRCRRAAS